MFQGQGDLAPADEIAGCDNCGTCPSVYGTNGAPLTLDDKSSGLARLEASLSPGQYTVQVDVTITEGKRPGRYALYLSCVLPPEPPVQCADHAGAATDVGGEICTIAGQDGTTREDRIRALCEGQFDDWDFSARDACCMCGGGTREGDTPPPPPPVQAFMMSSGVGDCEVDGYAMIESTEECRTASQFLAILGSGGGVSAAPVSVDQSTAPRGCFLLRETRSGTQAFLFNAGGAGFDASRGCVDMETGGTDSTGDNCTFYTDRRSSHRNMISCTAYSDADFSARRQCCACGGGMDRITVCRARTSEDTTVASSTVTTTSTDPCSIPDTPLAELPNRRVSTCAAMRDSGYCTAGGQWYIHMMQFCRFTCDRCDAPPSPPTALTAAEFADDACWWSRENNQYIRDTVTSSAPQCAGTGGFDYLAAPICDLWVYNCRHRGLTEVPLAFNPRATRINLGSNRLTTVGAGTLSDLEALEYLLLDSNLIHTVESGALRNLPMLIVLGMTQGNPLAAIHLGAFVGSFVDLGVLEQSAAAVLTGCQPDRLSASAGVSCSRCYCDEASKRSGQCRVHFTHGQNGERCARVRSTIVEYQRASDSDSCGGAMEVIDLGYSSRSIYAIGRTYHLQAGNISSVAEQGAGTGTGEDLSTIEPARRGFAIDPMPIGFYIDPSSGRVLGTPPASTARSVVNSTVYLTVDGQHADVLRASAGFGYAFADTDLRSNADGPNGIECLNGGLRVDDVEDGVLEFDLHYTCDCSLTPFPNHPNCDGTLQITSVTNWLQASYSTPFMNHSQETYQRYSWTDASPFVGVLNRAQWALGSTYHISPINVTAVAGGSAVDVTFQLVPMPPGFYIDSTSGELLGVPPRGKAWNETSRLLASVSGFDDAVLSEVHFEFKLRDVDPGSGATGPGGMDCAINGTRGLVDDPDDGVAEFDGLYRCDCANGWETGDSGLCDERSPVPMAAAGGPEDTKLIMSVASGIVGLLLIVVVVTRVQLYYANHRPVDVAAMQSKVLKDLGLALPTTIMDHELGLLLTFIDSTLNLIEQMDDGAEAWVDITKSLQSETLKHVPSLRNGMEFAKITAVESTKPQILLILPRPPGGRDETTERILSAAARRGKYSAGGYHVGWVELAAQVTVPPEVNRQTLTRLIPLGDGAFGEVWKCKDAQNVLPINPISKSAMEALAEIALEELSTRRSLGTPIAYPLAMAQAPLPLFANVLRSRRPPSPVHTWLTRSCFPCGRPRSLVDEVNDVTLATSFFVAAKTLKGETAGGNSRDDLLKEAAVMALFKHRNVVALVGVVTTPRDVPVLILLSFCGGGDLQSFIKKKGSENLDTADLLTYAAEVLRGLDHISSRRVIHRDIALRNVMLDNVGICKVGDFGASSNLSESQLDHVHATEMIPIRWSPAEVLLNGLFTTHSDVWSFGVMCWELFSSGALPYDDVTDDITHAAAFIRNGGRLTCPENCPIEVFEQVMLPCWAEEPADRPRFLSLYNSAVGLGAQEDGEALEETAVLRRSMQHSRRSEAHARIETGDRSLLGPSVDHLAHDFSDRVLAAVQAGIDNTTNPDHPESRFLIKTGMEATIWHMVQAFAK